MKAPLVLYYCGECGKVAISPQQLALQSCTHDDLTRYVREANRLRAA